MPRPFRVEFSKDHDAYLYKYLARYCPSKEGRSGRMVFQRLVANEHKMWPWCEHHTWQSWRERYVKNAGHFDALILSYQRKHNIKPTERQRHKRAAESMPIEMLGRSAKRARLEKEGANSSEMRTVHGAAAQRASPNSSMSKQASKLPREPPEPPSQVHPAGEPEPEPTDVRPSSPPHPTNDMNTDATRASLDLPALQTRHDTLEIPSSSNQPAPPPTDGESEPCSPPRVVKRKERPRALSEVFASESPSPSRVSAAVDDGSTPVAGTVNTHAPPRVVDSLCGRVLADRNGHVPRAFPLGEEDGTEEVEEDKARWPPPRDRNAKQRTTNGLDVEVDPHHAFSQPQPQPRSRSPPESVSVSERERGTPNRPLDGAPPDRCTAAALFTAGLRHDATPQAKSERPEDATRNGTAQVESIVPTPPTAPPTIPPSGLVPNSATKALKYPTPRASTQSPFRPSPARETRQPAPRKAVRHPALSRIRRQTIGYEFDNGRAREHLQVPSVDLVTLSRSSTSMRSHSRSSADASVPARPSRWSLPGAPSVPGPVSGSPSRWAAPLMHTDILGRARSSSFGESPTPRFMFTPSPVHSITALANNISTPAPHSNVAPVSPSLFIVPHPPDIPITASHGLASILAHMSANHGLALGVVEAVYARVGSLREADEVLRGMREAAEEFGERVIEKKVKSRHDRHEKQLRSGEGPRGSNGAGRGEKGKARQVDGDGDGNGMEWNKTLLRYVAASEDGEGSEYFPPETSRAAVWKEQLESPIYAEGEEGGNEDGKDEEQEEECAVEERLLEVEAVSENGNVLPGGHFFSRVLLDNMAAQELEGKVGRKQFHKDIVRQFV